MQRAGQSCLVDEGDGEHKKHEWHLQQHQHVVRMLRWAMKEAILAWHLLYACAEVKGEGGYMARLIQYI